MSIYMYICVNTDTVASAASMSHQLCRTVHTEAELGLDGWTSVAALACACVHSLEAIANRQEQYN